MLFPYSMLERIDEHAQLVIQSEVHIFLFGRTDTVGGGSRCHRGELEQQHVGHLVLAQTLGGLQA